MKKINIWGKWPPNLTALSGTRDIQTNWSQWRRGGKPPGATEGAPNALERVCFLPMQILEFDAVSDSANPFGQEKSQSSDKLLIASRLSGNLFFTPRLPFLTPPPVTLPSSLVCPGITLITLPKAVLKRKVLSCTDWNEWKPLFWSAKRKKGNYRWWMGFGLGVSVFVVRLCFDGEKHWGLST